MASATESEPRSASPARDRERLLVFVHIPKAAGTTFGRILRCHYGDGFERIGQSRRQELELAVTQRQHEAPAVLQPKPGLRAVSGHLAFGLRPAFPEDALCVTILREPVERTLSQFDYLLHRVGRPWNTDRLPPPTAELTIDEALDRHYIFDNLQTRMLCGLVSPREPLPPNALEEAKRNLRDQFAYVGTADRFAEFLALLNLELGWPTVAYKEGRVTPGRQRAQDLSADHLRAVEEANALDRDLFAHAGELLSHAIEQAGPELELEVEVLRRALPLERQAYRGEAVRDAPRVRSLPLEARTVLALREAELGRVRELLRKRTAKLTLLKDRARRRDERIKALKRSLERRSLKARLAGRIRARP